MNQPASPSLSARDRSILSTDIKLQQALEHIDRVYGQRILEIYALGYVAGFVSDEFNAFMNLRPPAERVLEKNWSKLLFSSLNLLLLVPGVGEAKELLHYGIIVSESVVEIGKQAIPQSSSDEEPDQGAATYLRERSLKMPLFQLILARRYQIEQERLDKRAEFLDELDKKLHDRHFTGTPLSFAIEKFGKAPPKLDPNAVYDLFLKQREQIFKEMMKGYVAKEVTIALWRKQYTPGGPRDEQYFPIVGLNPAQWRALYARYGKKSDPVERLLIHTRMIILDFKSMFVKATDYRYMPAPDPILTDVGDLWRLWGANLWITDIPWYGKPSTSYSPSEFRVLARISYFQRPTSHLPTVLPPSRPRSRRRRQGGRVQNRGS